ncbi:hypothetical protein JRQ81_017443 [Phrynocephalus forsythii]|uniref:Uncharacterized protein n=1 Tax=Phrynocephalus forsythii TaxID=171643 RepID=A0A9Q0XQZ1_9SAUR|nr:hypothetical protein JRQ81_017443 [Phrynocephalus forsythii]
MLPQKRFLRNVVVVAAPAPANIAIARHRRRRQLLSGCFLLAAATRAKSTTIASLPPPAFTIPLPQKQGVFLPASVIGKCGVDLSHPFTQATNQNVESSQTLGLGPCGTFPPVCWATMKILYSAFEPMVSASRFTSLPPKEDG